MNNLSFTKLNMVLSFDESGKEYSSDFYATIFYEFSTKNKKAIPFVKRE